VPPRGVTPIAHPFSVQDAMLGFRSMSMLLTKRRAVDLCRVSTCLCCRV
jgi:hypothetical protein